MYLLARKRRWWRRPISGGAPGKNRGAAPQGDKDGNLEQEELDEQRPHHKRGKREREKESPSPAAALPAVVEQRRRRWRNWSSSVRENVCECEREVTRVLPGLSTSREGRRGSERGGWRLAALPFMAGGLCGRWEKRNGRRIGEGIGCED
jgi:hypothetical protein